MGKISKKCTLIEYGVNVFSPKVLIFDVCPESSFLSHCVARNFCRKFCGSFFFGGLAIFCVLRELIFAIRIDCFLFLGTNFFAIFRNYAVPGIDNIFVFIEYVLARALGTCNRITLYYFQTIQLRCAYPM